MLEVILWHEASAQGRWRFFTGKPCKHGHVAERSVSNRMCVECNREGNSKRRVYERTGRTRPLEKLDIDPPHWLDDGGAKRVPIYDHMYRPPRLVRRVGWVNCLSPYGNDVAYSSRPHRFLSPDVTKVRVCPYCKTRVNNEHHRVDSSQPTRLDAGKGLAPVNYEKAPQGKQVEQVSEFHTPPLG